MLSNLHLGDILLHIANMVILFVIVRFLVYKPMRRFMQARSERIAASLGEVAQARGTCDALRAQSQTILAQAEEEARARSLEITGAANESARAMTESARAESRALLERAQAEIREEHDRAIAGLRAEVVDLATEMAAQILRQNAEGGDAL